jgi:hypothetical protein
MAFNSPILAVKSQIFGVMGISNMDKEFAMKVRPTCSHLPKLNKNITCLPMIFERIRLASSFSLYLTTVRFR